MMIPAEHGKLCSICGQPCDALAGNPGRWPVVLPRDGLPVIAHAGCIAAERDRLERTVETMQGEVEAAQTFSAATSAKKLKLIEAMEKIAMKTSGGLTSFSAEAKHEFLKDIGRICKELDFEVPAKSLTCGI
jgi:hypothetical protein